MFQKHIVMMDFSSKCTHINYKESLKYIIMCFLKSIPMDKESQDKSMPKNNNELSSKSFFNNKNLSLFIYFLTRISNITSHAYFNTV